VSAPAPVVPSTPDVPEPSGITVWGVAVPIGCVPLAAQPAYIRFACLDRVDRLHRFYTYRFPAAHVERRGSGIRVVPDRDHSGRGHLQAIAEGQHRSRLTVYKARFVGDDPDARRIIARLVPAELRDRTVIPLRDQR
jgi:hypothetical protein